ncbi:aspartic peptidase domain-containing protein [Crepidotus variabilis]|uniref:Aspartic peptidase domain-containing protein n=1 Tax=Crepidotus variabilis TaxID=179855 RepID=A0A9P6EN61_9AGAR|nr:aspartic peptidase domain-containing protein [Crepidotus variabilis]
MSLGYRRWKGKARAVESRDEGPGGTDGIVLPLELAGSGVYDGAYTLPVKFGAKNQQFSLQIDTGSSDLWVASSSCSTSSCQLTNGRLYDPSNSRPTDVNFEIPYLEGSAAGPVVWDQVTIGGYSIENQAFAAANNVQAEPLAPNFSGILGLALPLNSIIAKDIPPVTSNDPDGAAWASNLFSITPTENAPSARFLSISLSRPGSDQIPALLGIGRHPSSVVPDPSQIKYSSLVGDQNGVLFWKVNVRAITVYVNSVPMHINVGRAGNGGAFPSAVLDTGVPLILTTSTVANAIYGAIGINPASDGKYYVPCTTPLNMTFTIDSRPEIPIHPLDLTAEPPDDYKSESCIGLIQAADGALGRPDSTIGDMILGVPFMRNVYTVLAYTAPDKDGNFAPVPSDDASTGTIKTSADNTSSIAISHINPRLGLLSLTDPKRALDEFNTVRVLNQPISSSGVNSGSTSHTGNTINVGGAKISVGVVVLIGVLSFFALCAALFFGRWLMMRRRFKKASMENGSETAFGVIDKKTAYMLARRASGNLGPGGGALSEDELRDLKYREYMKRDRLESTMDSEKTMTAMDSATSKKDGHKPGDEFGFRRSKASGGDEEEPWDPATAIASGWGGDATLVGSRGANRGVETSADVATPLVSDQDRNTPPASPELLGFNHRHQYSDSDPSQSLSSPHRPQKSVDVPLLSAQHHHNGSSGPATVLPEETSTSRPPFLPSESFHSNNSRYSDHYPDELGRQEDSSQVGMAGVGTASRTSRVVGMDTSFRDNHRVPSLSFNRDNMMPMSSSGAAVGVAVGNSIPNSSIPRTSLNSRNR